MCNAKNCKCSKRKHNNRRKHKFKKSRIIRKNRHTGGGIQSVVKSAKQRLLNTKQTVAKNIDKRMRKNALTKDGMTMKKNGFDLHGASLGLIKKIFGKRGMVPPPYKYLGPGNPLDKQVVIGPNGMIKKYLVRPYNALDQIASKHDVCYGNKKKLNTNVITR